MALLLTFLLLLPTPLSAGVIRKMDGTIAEGEFRLDTPGQLTFTPRIGQPQRIALEDVLLAQFKTPTADPMLPVVQRWKGQDIGRIQPGMEMLRGGMLTVRGGGGDISGNKDELRFVYQQLTGDAQVSARVLNMTQTNSNAIAGVMIRDSLDTAAPYVMCLLNAGGGASMQYRRSLGAASTLRSGGDLSVPAYIKVTRSGATFTALISPDGQNWEQLGAQQINMRPGALVGIGVCAHNSSAICTATFERVSISATGGRPSPSSGGAGVLLRDGSIISGQLLSVNTSSIHLSRPREGDLPISLIEIAQIHFSGGGRELATKAPHGVCGVMDSKGGFIEGEIQGIANNQIRLSSVLFGLRQFELNQTAAAIFSKSAQRASKYQVTAADGSVINSDKVEVEKDQLVVQSAAGPLRFTAAEIVELRAGTASYRPLAELKPTLATPTGSLPGQVIASLAGNPTQHGLELSPTAAIAYNLNAEYRLLSLTWGVRDGIAPLAPARLRIIGDNKELYLSPPRTTLDDPLPLGINVAGVKVLRFQVDAVLPTAITPTALLADAALVK